MGAKQEFFWVIAKHYLIVNGDVLSIPLVLYVLYAVSGLMNRDYELTMANVNPVIINHCTGTGIAMSIAANRISYAFNFTGPSLSIDCACSSSLVALHLACQAMRQGKITQNEYTIKF